MDTKCFPGWYHVSQRTGTWGAPQMSPCLLFCWCLGKGPFQSNGSICKGLCETPRFDFRELIHPSISTCWWGGCIVTDKGKPALRKTRVEFKDRIQIWKIFVCPKTDSSNKKTQSEVYKRNRTVSFLRDWLERPREVSWNIHLSNYTAKNCAFQCLNVCKFYL